jgi:hypothetical protein
MTETRYTLAEAKREFEVRACANGGHAPGTVIHAGLRAIRAYCECGKVRWLPDEEAK